jgi:hypothetical protein
MKMNNSKKKGLGAYTPNTEEQSILSLPVKRIIELYLDSLMNKWMKIAHSYEGGEEFLLYLEEKVGLDLIDLKAQWFIDWWKSGFLHCSYCKKGSRHWLLLEDDEINYCSISCKKRHERKISDDLIREWGGNCTPQRKIIECSHLKYEDLEMGKCAGCDYHSLLKDVKIGSISPTIHKLCRECEECITSLPPELISGLEDIIIKTFQRDDKK